MAEDILLRSVSYREGSVLKSTLLKRAIVWAELPEGFNEKTTLSEAKKLNIVRKLEASGIKSTVRNLKHDLDLFRSASKLCYGTKEDRKGILNRLLKEDDPIATPLLCLIKDGVAQLQPEEMALIPEEFIQRAGTGHKREKKAREPKPKVEKLGSPKLPVPKETKIVEEDAGISLEVLLKKHAESLLVNRSFMEGMVLSIKRLAEENLGLKERDKKRESRIQSLENEVAKLNKSMVKLAQWMLKKKIRNAEDLFQQFPEMLTSREIIEERLSKPSNKVTINLPKGGRYLGEARFRYLYDDKFFKCLHELPPPKQRNVERILERFAKYGPTHKALESKPAPAVTDDMPKNSFIGKIDRVLRLIWVTYEEDKRVMFIRIAPHNEVWKSEG